jgi:hypothetical protein
MEHADQITSTIDTYLETNDLEEEELSVLMQLDFDDQYNEFTIDYTLTSHDNEAAMTIHTNFGYDSLPEAWENYLDQIGEVNQNYPTANIENPHPEVYKGGKIGGNPVMSIRDGESEL